MGRSPCCEKAHTNKGAWTKDEDERLVAYIKAHGEGCWRSLPKAAGLLRCGKSCRLRWINYLRPDLKRGNFTPEEDELIIKLHSILGNKWSLIAGRLPGRTDNEIKNYWNTHIRRKLLIRGIDPATHRPISGGLQPTDLLPAAENYMNTGKHLASKGEGDDKVAVVEGGDGLCPDLNLDLRISPPYFTCQEPPPPPLQFAAGSAGGGQRVNPMCFACSLGILNSTDCSCKGYNIAAAAGE
ncbi:unnamed protein product [Cuscuta campestris]|uniref:Uncharacterized protein n=1 Tax=Cuscuta campestris TaxID=132261 RepID=A0A484MVH5_9ASTE|nr:unnamed protein product [Cuscuta campestris]